uniref:Photosystem II reaction center Psb28 protein n=1 Tax=Synura sphagnicola TaxID=52556 RepID=A0A3G2QYM5_9STRA|nr:photosystem II protein W [Synura sphagnicola]
MFELRFYPNLIKFKPPLIRLTKSLNGETGTATLIFFQFQFLIELKKDYESCLKSLTFISDKKSVETTDISVFFRNGKPFFIKVILILKNPTEWFYFLYFMNSYAKQNELSFLDERNNSLKTF